MISIYVTCGTESEAQDIGRDLVKKKLVACANYFPIKSIFEWKGTIEAGDEFVLLLKTVDEKYDRVVLEVKKMHSYEIPCIIKYNVDADLDYENWVKSQVTG